MIANYSILRLNVGVFKWIIDWYKKWNDYGISLGIIFLTAYIKPKCDKQFCS